MSNVCTSIEQSKKLLELGIDINTADMCWSTANPDLEVLLAFPFADADNSYDDKIPCWSLAALLKLLPNGSQVNKSSNGRYFCSGVLYDNPIDACVNEIEVLTDTGNLKFNKEEGL